MQMRIKTDKKNMEEHRRRYAQKAEQITEYAKRLKQGDKMLTADNLRPCANALSMTVLVSVMCDPRFAIQSQTLIVPDE